jgi:hypothetical protein
MLMAILDLVRSYKMDNVTFTQIEKPFEVIEEIAIIDRGNGEFTSMQKTIYDAMQAEQSTPTFN